MEVTSQTTGTAGSVAPTWKSSCDQNRWVCLYVKRQGFDGLDEDIIVIKNPQILFLFMPFCDKVKFTIISKKKSK